MSVHCCKLFFVIAALLIYASVASTAKNLKPHAAFDNSFRMPDTNLPASRRLRTIADVNYGQEDRAIFGITGTKIKDFGAKKLQKLTEGVQTKAQQRKVDRWIAERKTEDWVFKLQQLDEEGTNILKSPKLSTWMDFVIKRGKDPYDFLLFKLRRRYDNDELAKMLVLSKNDASSRAIAEKLETLQLEKWMKDEKSIIDVFRFLKLNEEGLTLLKSPVLSTWVSYVEKLKKDPYELLFLAIKSTGFDEAKLAKMIGSAKDDTNTAFIAKKMEELQLEKWVTAEKSGDDVFKNIGLDKEGDKLFESPVWSTWVAYLNKQRGNSHEEMFSVLRNRLGDVGLTNAFARAKGDDSKLTKDIAAKLEMDIWRMNGHTSDDLFKMLKLNEKGDKVLESPTFSTWAAYVLKLESYRKTPDEFATIRQLERHYDDATLARMLANSKRRADTASTKGYIADLQELQFKKWVVERTSPNVFALLVRKKFLTSDRVKRDFRDFLKRNADKFESS
ncbi:hypothetical protein L915_05014 [Phytophthora nicotianae]|nr:hypothetical protein L915_05014 [Phytophthora nicotianae]ETL44801.1 hypothetical protein L916_04964 [Phytophthora nicotianae]